MCIGAYMTKVNLTEQEAGSHPSVILEDDLVSESSPLYFIEDWNPLRYFRYE